MTFQRNFDYKIISVLSNCVSGHIVAVEIQNFSAIISVTQNVGLFESMIVELQEQIQNQFSAAVMRHSHDIFFIILNSDIVVEKEIVEFIYDFHNMRDDDMYMSCAIGCKTFDERDKKNLDLVYKSLIALQNAIDMGCKYYSYQESDVNLIEAQKKEMMVANSVMKAMSKNNIAVALQPVASVDTGNVIFYEALLRLVDKKNNFVMVADSFIPIAEKIGVIDLLDNISFELIKDELLIDSSVNISMNMSVRNIQDKIWREKFINALYDFPLAKCLIIEITETWYKRSYDVIADFVLDVKKVGCKVALDDFGSGYGSILEVIKMDIDFLKVSKVIMEDIHNDDRKANALKLINDMAISFGVDVIAEFVFCEEQIEILKKIGIKYMQGFKVGEPLIKFR